jgi:hypothetical protein
LGGALRGIGRARRGTQGGRKGAARCTQQELHPSNAALDGAIASGMEHGIRETMEQLERLVESFIATRDSQYTSHDLELQASDAIEKRVALREGNQ